MYKLKIKLVNKDFINDTLKKELERGMNDLVLDMKNDATTKAYEGSSELSQRTGQLGSTMKADTKWEGKVLVGKVTTHVVYAEYLEHGTGEFADQHRGGARTKYLGKIPALVGKNGEKDKGYRWIKGQKGKHYMLRTFEEYKPKAKKYFKIRRG